MAEPCLQLDPRSRKTLSVILQALASVGQKPVADAIGKSEATVSRMKDGDLQSFSLLLTTIGLKPVPIEAVCHDADYLKHLEYFAEIGMKRRAKEGLDWSDE